MKADVTMYPNHPWWRCLALAIAACLSASVQAQTPTSKAVLAQSLACLITPSNIVELGAPSVGIVQQVFVERGDTVKKGQVLATLRGEVERANLGLATTRAQAEAELQAADRANEFAQRKLKRTQDLFEKEFVSALAVDQAVADAQAAEAHQIQTREQLLQAQKERAVVQAQLDLRTLRSPMDGVIVDLYRRSGERVEERPVLKIAALDPLFVEVVLPASLYRSIKPGMSATIQPDLPELPPLNGTVRLADRLIDPASNTFRARIVVPNPDSKLPAGLRCKASFGNSTPTSPSSEKSR
jgi:RND family efflux transporter MFP subunit